MNDLPIYSDYTAENIVNRIQERIKCNVLIIQDLQFNSQATWISFISILEYLDVLIINELAIITHLNSVDTNPAFALAYSKVLQLYAEYSAIFMDEKFYKTYQKIYNEDVTLNQTQKILLKRLIFCYQMSGIDLPKSKQLEFQWLSEQLQQLAVNFDENQHANLDNTKTIHAILDYRFKLATLMGYQSYAHYILTDRLLDNPEKVLGFLNSLLLQYPESLEKFSLPEMQIQIESAISVIFELIKDLFAIDIKEVAIFPSWNDQVRLFEVYTQEKICGRFYLDCYKRESKRSGSWCAELRSRYKHHQQIQLPLIAIVTNFDATLSHFDFLTLLHELGHCLQKILTIIDHPMLAGDHGLPLEATEFVSQFMEHWGWEANILNRVNKREDQIDYIKCKNAQHRKNVLKDVKLAITDIRIHLNEVVNTAEIQQFKHIFTGGFECGFYSYLYAAEKAKIAFDFCKKNNAATKFKHSFLESGGASCFTTALNNYLKK